MRFPLWVAKPDDLSLSSPETLIPQLSQLGFEALLLDEKQWQQSAITHLAKQHQLQLIGLCNEPDQLIDCCQQTDFVQLSSNYTEHAETTQACQSEKPLLICLSPENQQTVSQIVAALRKANQLNHVCIYQPSLQPLAADQCNLATLGFLRQRYQCSVGWYDTTANPAVILRVLQRWYAGMITLQVSLNEETASGWWSPARVKALRQLLDESAIADGTKLPMHDDIWNPTRQN